MKSKTVTSPRRDVVYSCPSREGITELWFSKSYDYGIAQSRWKTGKLYYRRTKTELMDYMYTWRDRVCLVSKEEMRRLISETAEQ